MPEKASGKPKTYTGANNTSSSNPAIAVNSAAPAPSTPAGELELLTLVHSLQADIKKIKNRRGKGSSKGGGTSVATTSSTPAAK